MATQSERALTDVRNMCHQLGNPNWMANPRSWIWTRPDGLAQGFGPAWRESPGLANLLWLSMDFREPPQVYDATKNSLYMYLMMFAGSSKLHGLPLLDLAGLRSLQAFHTLLPAGETLLAGGNSLERAYPLLKLLAQRRLHAYP